ncbi:MAG TPA: glycosyltransferase family 39 protein [archaeon]|nr:glycosyltransferase family 39 protein [archaeon]
MNSHLKALIKNRLAWLIVISITVRLVYGLSYSPIMRKDSHDYYRIAKSLVSGDYTDYKAAYPPVYPLLIAASGFDWNRVAWVQVAMGVGIAVLLYLIFSGQTGSNNIGFILGLSYALNPSQLLFEFNFFSETACTFFLVLTVYLFARLVTGKSSPHWKELSLLGFSCSLCVLTRAQFELLPLIIAFFLVYHLKFTLGERIRKVGFFLAPAIILLGLWGGFNYKKIGQFVMSSELGFDLTNHTVKFIEYAPDRYEEIKQLLLGIREMKIKRHEDVEYAAMIARPQLMRLLGLSYPETSKKMLEVSLATIQEKPLLYLKSVAHALIRFFKPTWYGHLLGIRPAIAKGGWLVKTIASSYCIFQLFCMLVFLSFPVWWLIVPRYREIFRWDIVKVFIYVLVFSTAIVQAIVEFVENHRYKTSVEPFIICLSLLIIIKIISSRLPRRHVESRISDTEKIQ